jgi:hypothetical protein
MKLSYYKLYFFLFKLVQDEHTVMVKAGAVGGLTASHWGFTSTKMMRLLAAPTKVQGPATLTYEMWKI